MTRYEILDSIADTYTPLLLIAYLSYSIFYFRAGDRTAYLKGLWGLAVAYLIMFLDNATQLWHAFNLDYSTHSSVALAFIMFHLHKRKLVTPPAIGIIGSLLAYYLLEIYQQYHSAADILSTVIIIAPLILLGYWGIGHPKFRLMWR
ncbi:MAG: hypothetical protein COA42_16740 [Alteromonadaceae bacterium]|nr:MAG: hypothetical protein COA42_16740 [Alteromonadaceae bacterium]